MQSPICVKAKAKINLFLNLLKNRDDGFHEVRFVMQQIELADLIEVRVKKEGFDIDFDCSDPGLCNNDNLLVRAYHMFYGQTGLSPFALKVNLQKTIPVQAGLGGGSSDAAAMLSVLNLIHGESVESVVMHNIAEKLGSDVPFFLTGKTAVAEGRGEKIKPVPALPLIDVALVKPRYWGISTSDAFKWIQDLGDYRTVDFCSWKNLLESGSCDAKTIGKLLYNDFEKVVFARYPQLAKVKQVLLEEEFPGALLSGSGPTVFALMDKPALQWPKIEKCFNKDEWLCINTCFSQA